MKRVLELIRVSTEGQAASDRASIPAQRGVNKRTCAQYDLEIVKTFEISDVSGASVLLAPEIQQLLALMQSPEIHGVVTREFSRLMRPENFTDYALLQAFADSKTILYLPEGPIDFTSKTGRLMGAIRAAIAGLERTEILERIWSAKEEKRRRGELAQSEIVLPWGVGYEQNRGFFYKPQTANVKEAFRQFLGGNQSYLKLSELLGVSPRGVHIIMRNPIWTGWRVIDKKRDMSATGRYAGLNGRQTDRRKISRAPDEVIRVRVITEPLISEPDFQAVQRLMDLTQRKHWRSQPNLERRFTYNGFLSCSACGQIVHTALARRDYYACKGRRTSHTCSTKYMARERLEKELDSLFANKLTLPGFLEQCIRVMKKRTEKNESAAQTQQLTSKIDGLRRKRLRVIEGFIEGIIPRDERDRRLADIDRDVQAANEILLRETPAAAVDLPLLVESFAPLVEWEHWTRDQKRAVLSSLVPDIRVANYNIESLGLPATLFKVSNHNSLTGRGSWQLPA
jgi:DNA invertase Pin-like site-specific DNA recombinase